MGDESPLISVVMPVHNAGRYLGPAVQCILGQSFTDFEFLVFDDGSTDGSADVLRDLRDPRVIAAFSATNFGYIHWLNTGVQRARGRYIARMDADDLCDRDRFRRQVEFLETHPNHVAVGTAFRAVDGDGNDLGAVPIVHTHREIRLGLLDRSHFAHGSMLIRNTGELFYDREYYPAEDYDLWVRLLSAGRLANLTDELYAWRRHDQGTTHRATELSVRNSNRIRDRYVSDLVSGGRCTRLLEAALSPIVGHERGRELWRLFRANVRDLGLSQSERRALFVVLLRNVGSPRLSVRYVPCCIRLLSYSERVRFFSPFLREWLMRRARRCRFV